MNLEITPNLILFGGLATISALTAVGVVWCNNAIRSALCLVVNFFILAFIYFTLNAEMMGITQVVVYTGAIMVLFLFVVMLLNLGAPQLLHEKFDAKRPIGILLGLAMAAVIAAQVMPPLMENKTPRTTGVFASFGSPQAIGNTLFTEYVVPFETVSVLLLIGIVGSILLAKRKI